MKNIITQFKNGFTLAEVLITLVIVGVVAAMTIPTLVNNTKKQEYVAGLKKANSVLSQSLYKMTENNAYPVGDYSYLRDKNFINEFAKVVSVAKKCDTFADCFAKNPNSYKRLNNGNADITDGKSIVISDGQMFSYAETNLATNSGLSDDDKNNIIGRIVVDVNGGKNPNQYGYDLFFFYIVEHKGIVPSGSYSTSDCTKSGEGITCAARVLRENAINY